MHGSGYVEQIESVRIGTHVGGILDRAALDGQVLGCLIASSLCVLHGHGGLLHVKEAAVADHGVERADRVLRHESFLAERKSFKCKIIEHGRSAERGVGEEVETGDRFV